MDQIFEFIINIMMAYFQIIILLFGSVFLLCTCVVIGDFFQKRKSNRHFFTATVKAIREGESIPDENGAKRKLYYPVFEGVGQDGKNHQYECQTNSNDINHYKIGVRFQVAIIESQENFVSIKGDEKNDVIIAAVLAAIGSGLCFMGLKVIPFTQMTFIVWGITVVVLAFKFSRYIKPKHLRETMAQFKVRRNRERPILAYTINDPQLARQLRQWGVDAMFTDDPDIVNDSLFKPH